jgi:hypothetical protein
MTDQNDWLDDWPEGLNWITDQKYWPWWLTQMAEWNDCTGWLTKMTDLDDWPEWLTRIPPAAVCRWWGWWSHKRSTRSPCSLWPDRWCQPIGIWNGYRPTNRKTDWLPPANRTNEWILATDRIKMVDVDNYLVRKEVMPNWKAQKSLAVANQQ